MIHVPLDRVLDSPYQPRRHYDEAAIEQLADSIERDGPLQVPAARLVNAVGVGLGLNAVTQCLYAPTWNGWTAAERQAQTADWMTGENWSAQLAFGHRRARAWRVIWARRAGDLVAGAAGVHGVPPGCMPVALEPLTDEQMFARGVSENRHREGVSGVEEAEAMRAAETSFGWTHERIGERFGYSRSAVTNKLRLLKLPADVRELNVVGRLPERTARALVAMYDLDDELQPYASAGFEHQFSAAEIGFFLDDGETHEEIAARVRVYVEAVQGAAKRAKAEREPALFDAEPAAETAMPQRGFQEDTPTPDVSPDDMTAPEGAKNRLGCELYRLDTATPHNYGGRAAVGDVVSVYIPSVGTMVSTCRLAVVASVSIHPGRGYYAGREVTLIDEVEYLDSGKTERAGSELSLFIWHQWAVDVAALREAVRPEHPGEETHLTGGAPTVEKIMRRARVAEVSEGTTDDDAATTLQPEPHYVAGPNAEPDVAADVAVAPDDDAAEWALVEGAVVAALRTIPTPARAMLSRLLIDLGRSARVDPSDPSWPLVARHTILGEMRDQPLDRAGQTEPTAREAAAAWGLDVEWPEPESAPAGQVANPEIAPDAPESQDAEIEAHPAGEVSADTSAETEPELTTDERVAAVLAGDVDLLPTLSDAGLSLAHGRAFSENAPAHIDEAIQQERARRAADFDASAVVEHTAETKPSDADDPVRETKAALRRGEDPALIRRDLAEAYGAAHAAMMEASADVEGEEFGPAVARAKSLQAALDVVLERHPDLTQAILDEQHAGDGSTAAAEIAPEVAPA